MNHPLMHGTDWSRQDVSGWWVSEKFDGWRALWTGSEFLTRQGKALNAPEWFKAGMPKQPLDGELYAGSETNHNDVTSAVRSGDWARLTFRPFDVPSPGVTVEAAMAILASLSLPSHVQPVQFSRVESTEDAIAEMFAVCVTGGEGVMLRRPGSEYCAERTQDLLKLKPGFESNI